MCAVVSLPLMFDSSCMNRSITLRAFKLHSDTLSQNPLDVELILRDRLQDPNLNFGKRRMALTEESDLEDVLTSYRLRGDESVFGTMFRLMQPDDSGIVPNSLDTKEQVTYSDILALNDVVSEGERSVVVIKDTCSFLIKGEYLITNLSGNTNIERVQTYLNWLLENVRNGQLIKYTHITHIPNDLKLNEIKDIEVAPDVFINTESSTPVRTFLSEFKEATSDLFKNFSASKQAIQELQDNQLLGYKLLLFIKGKPKEMSKKRYEEILSTTATASAFDDGVKLRTTRGTLSRDNLFERKSVQVEFVDGKMNLRSLEERMEGFLNEVRDRRNGSD